MYFSTLLLSLATLATLTTAAPTPNSDCEEGSNTVWVEVYSTGFIWRRDGYPLTQNIDGSTSDVGAAGNTGFGFTALWPTGGGIIAPANNGDANAFTAKCYTGDGLSGDREDCGTCQGYDNGLNGPPVESHGEVSGPWAGRNGKTFYKCEVTDAWGA